MYLLYQEVYNYIKNNIILIVQGIRIQPIRDLYFCSQYENEGL